MLSRPTQPSLREPPSTARAGGCSNVIDLQLRVLPGHVELLTRWLHAGRSMGLCDASAVHSRPGRMTEVEPQTDYVLVWVRENPDPAYMITPGGTSWTVSDCVRDQVLGRLRTFVEALEFIRPVLGTRQAA